LRGRLGQPSVGGIRSVERARTRRRHGATWHHSHVSNGPTEATNNLVKRVAFGFKLFKQYRIRALLYAGKPNWTLLNKITPP